MSAPVGPREESHGPLGEFTCRFQSLQMAYRAFQRGDIPMTAVLTLVGVVLTVYRLKTGQNTVRLSPNKALLGTSPKLLRSFGATPERGC